MKHAVDDAGSAGIGEKFAVIANQPARRRQEYEPRLARARRPHVLHFALALADLLDDHAGIGIVDVDCYFLDGLQPFARVRIRVVQHARPADGEFETLPPHRFDQHAELQFAAPRHFEGRFSGLAHLDGDIAFGFAKQAIANDAALYFGALAARQRRIVHRDGDGERGRIDRRRRDRHRYIEIAERIGHRRRHETCDRHDVAGFGAFDRHARQPAKGEQLGCARAFDLDAVARQRLELAVNGDGAHSMRPVRMRPR